MKTHRAIILIITLAILCAGCSRHSRLSGVYQARGFIQFQGSNPRMEFLPDGHVKRTNDEGIGHLDTYSVANGVVTITSADPRGTHFLEFRVEDNNLALSSGETFYKQ